MFRLLVVPVFLGILAFSIVYFVIPLLFSEADAVAVFASLVLDLSNSVFVTTPPLVSAYLAHASLPLVAVTVAILIIVATQALVLVGDALVGIARVIAWLFKRRPKPTGPKDLPPLEIGSARLNSRPGNEILGGGFDSLDSDR